MVADPQGGGRQGELDRQLAAQIPYCENVNNMTAMSYSCHSDFPISVFEAVVETETHLLLTEME